MGLLYWNGSSWIKSGSGSQAIITASTSGNTQVVAAVASKIIRVLSYNYTCNGTVNVKFQSNTTDKSGLGYFVANTGKVCNWNPDGWFQTNSGEALNINLSGNVAVGGELTYILI